MDKEIILNNGRDSHFLKLSRKYMLLVAFWPLETKQKCTAWAYKIASQVMNYYFLTGIIGMIMTVPIIWQDANRLSECFNHIVIYFLSWLKMYFLKSRRIRHLLANISVEEDRLLKSPDENLRWIAEKYIKLNHRICTGFAGLTINNCAIFLLLATIKIFTFKGEKDRPTMFHYKLPAIDMDKYYLQIYGLNLASLYCGCFYFVAQEVLIFTLIVYALCRIKIFQYVLGNAEKSARVYAKQNEVSLQKAVGIVLRNCVLEHNKVIR